MLHPGKLAVSGGILWGLGISMMTLLNLFFAYGDAFIALMANIYPFYTVSYMGAIVGFFWGFLDMGVFLYLLAWIYNKL